MEQSTHENQKYNIVPVLTEQVDYFGSITIFNLIWIKSTQSHYIITILSGLGNPTKVVCLINEENVVLWFAHRTKKNELRFIYALQFFGPQLVKQQLFNIITFLFRQIITCRQTNDKNKYETKIGNSKKCLCFYHSLFYTDF